MIAWLLRFFAHFPPQRVAPVALVAATAIILVALASEHIGGLKPCDLCYQQRHPYYIGVPLLLVATLRAHFVPDRAKFTGLLMVLAAAIFTYSFFLAAYHAGVEWGIFEGPQGCGGAAALPGSTADLLRAMQGEKIPRCDIPAWTLFGISLAGYNAITSFALAKLCSWAAGQALFDGAKPKS